MLAVNERAVDVEYNQSHVVSIGRRAADVTSRAPQP